jgi:hypothetical protein
MMFAPPIIEQPAPADVPPRKALLCVERPEQNGTLNLVPTMVRVVGLQEGPTGNPEVPLIGGQNACFRVEGRKGQIQVRFARWLLGPSDPKTYWTASFPVVIERHESIYVLDAAVIQPADEKDWQTTGWHHQWRLESLAAICRSAPQWEACRELGGR